MRGAAPAVHEHVTALVGLWGELLLKDIAQPVAIERGGCCGDAPAAGPECFPLTSGSGANATCRDYVRSLPALHDDCHFQHRDQMNAATGFLDASALYGNSEEEARSLQAAEGGLVVLENCRMCQAVGSGLSTLASLFLREHNRLAVRLAALNPHWDGDTLFVEARRLVAAQLQHITYSEFLPTVLGEVTMESWDLTPRDRGHYTGYSSGVHAGALASVGVAAMHAFRSMVPPALVSNTTSPGRMDALNEQRFTRMVQAVTGSPALQPSLRMPGQQRQQRADNHQDMDPAALLLHRGRDHGLAAYPNWLSFCTQGVPLTDPVDFSYLSSHPGLFTEDRIQKLKSAYRDVLDVDLLAGATLETPAQGAVMGPTLGCLLAEQFSVLRAGDRFWYENDIPPSSFSRAQLDEIRRVTLGGVICSNTPDLSELQPQAFVREDPYLNVRIACGLQPSLQLSSAWKDARGAANIPESLVREAVQRAEKELTARQQFEYRTWADKGGIDPKSSQGTAAAFSKANKEALHMANSSLLFEYASEELLNSLTSSSPATGSSRQRRQIIENLIGFTRDDILSGDGLQDIDVRPFVGKPPTTFDDSMCAAPVADDTQPCDPTSPFRTFSGHCNNLRKPSLGKSLSTFNRLLPPAYENGVSRPRLTSVTGTPLPSPRLVSTMIHADISNLHTRYSLMVMQFAQFLDHDLTFTPVHRGYFASIPDCRSCDSARTVHPECMPIAVPPGDHFFPPANQSTGERLCFPFMRSLPGQQHLGPRDQINQNTAFLDGSMVYGDQACLGRDLRAFGGGRLNVTLHPVRGKDLMPQSPLHPECRAPSGYCFIAGDGRASEQPGLTAIHTVFMREHNRLADGLRAVNPHWDDDHLYHHARRILGGAIQHMAFNEFLPRILGWNAVNLYGLKLQPHGYYKGYSPTCNPAILNEFASAAFRIGHSLLRPHIPRMSPTYKPIDPPLLLRDGFFNPDAIYQAHIVDEIIRGLVSTPMENLDQFITGEITNHLFEDRRIPHSGFDLIALNIQRGRDHAIRPYNDYRALCNLKRATSWEDLSREIPAEVIARLQRIYPTVDDIDLFPGGMSERPLQGGLVGPTFACIIGIQFRQVRKCDRFWYENDDPATRFTEAQLAEIRKATLSKVLCSNLDADGDMQRSALDQPSNFLNPRLPCHSLPSIDLTAWRETHQGCNIGGRNVAAGESALPSPCTSCICTEEGAQCASLRITDCGQLMREASRDSILRDDVCMAQCGFLLDPATAAASPASGLGGLGPASGPGSGPGTGPGIEFTTAPSRRPGAGRQLDLLAPPPFRRGPSGPPPRAARRNPRVLRPGPSAPGFSGLRIPDFSILG
ncbi:uncharacterized protein LOC117646626 [Thrips palmi]|uniref:peroxidase n=1 Tax=Thrips palmi TaxID=161013 RepID=A0A6P8Z1S4_THRPL|nr:uncharacterized protein LOC117646626 [Thrips palmi]